MILTITLNSALDRILFIDEFQPGTTMRPHKMLEGVGGKGFDTSVVLQMLGRPNVALGVVAGVTGHQLARLLERYSIESDLVWVNGETRIAHVLIEVRHHRHSHIVAAGLSVSTENYQEIVKRYQGYLDRAAWIIGGGSLATGVPVTAYRQLTELANRANVPILIDSSGPPILEAASAQPTILKMNDQEFADTFGIQTRSLETLMVEARRLLGNKQLPSLVITCGVDGILALTPESTYLAQTPPQQVVNAAGAGDGVSAALAWRFSQGDAWPEALRWAAATGAAVVLTDVTAECRPLDVERLWGQTTVQAWEE